MIPVFVGHDSRQPLSYNVMRYSIERHSSSNVVVRGLFIDKLPIKRTGATDFTFSRFLVPWLCDYEGWAIFCDEDQVVKADIAELWEHCRRRTDAVVMVNKNQPAFEWPSVMVFNCARCKALAPEYIDDTANSLYDFDWADGHVVDFPSEWNHAVGISPSTLDAKLYHYTQGIPYWPECRGLPEDQFWWEEYNETIKSVEWLDLHRNTKHFTPVITRMLRRYGVDLRTAP